jgi:3-dehydroquinate synthase
MNIILCGLPGSGKTTVGQILAKNIKGSFIDIDHMIECEYAKCTGETLTSRQIFNQKGGPFFRKLESLTVVKLASKPLRNVVISLGGGALETAENINIIKNLGTLVYLKVDLKVLFERINRNGLPAYLDPKDPFASFETLAEKRISLFEQSADIHIVADLLTPEAIAREILKTSKTIELSLTSKPIRYPIIIQEGLLLSAELIEHVKSSNASLYTIFTDTNVEKLHAKNLEIFLKKEGLNVSLFSLPVGEDFKTRETKESCENHLLSLGAGRDTCIIAIGGGVITDLAGFVASTYLRGVPAILIPTSLLAMVDASIGGKTGVNVPEGKNLIGAICQPHAVLIDTTIIKTLPIAEIKNGISEMIKHGLIADKEYFDFMKINAQNILGLDLPLMEKAIYDSITIKAHIVEQDETEHGKRRLLNYGHTFAHAIETATNHDIAHGRAVAIGIIAASYLSMLLGYLQKSDFTSIREIFNTYQIDLTWENALVPDQIYNLMRMDKKAAGKNPKFVLLEQIGKPLEFSGQYCSNVDEKLLKTTLEWMCTDVMRRH